MSFRACPSGASVTIRTRTRTRNGRDMPPRRLRHMPENCWECYRRMKLKKHFRRRHRTQVRSTVESSCVTTSNGKQTKMVYKKGERACCPPSSLSKLILVRQASNELTQGHASGSSNYKSTSNGWILTKHRRITASSGYAANLVSENRQS